VYLCIHQQNHFSDQTNTHKTVLKKKHSQRWKTEISKFVYFFCIQQQNTIDLREIGVDYVCTTIEIVQSGFLDGVLGFLVQNSMNSQIPGV
jgi:glycerol kinase